jgi:hypothetical protein
MFPALLAYRCWGLGVQAAGPNIAGFFANLTPAVRRAAVGAADLWRVATVVPHGGVCALIVGGIVSVLPSSSDR